MKGAGKLALVLAALLLLTACGQTVPSVGGSTPPAEESPAPVSIPFSLPYYEEVSLHPITGMSQTNLTLASQVYEGLFELDNQFKASAVLAESWQQEENGLVWTFRIKQASFSDGSPLTGEDVANSLEEARKSERYGARLKDVRAVRAKGDTVTVTLNRPHGNLPVLLDIPVVRERGDGVPLGTGWYAFAEKNGGMVLERTSRCPEGLPEEISLASIQSAEELLYAFDTRDISLVVSDLTGSDTLGFSGGYEIWDHPTTTMVYLGFRTDSGFCRDEVVRQAVSCALDREGVVNTLYALHARTAVLPVSPQSGLYDADVAGMLEYTNQHAAELLKNGGYSLRDGVLYQGRWPVTLTLIVSTDNSFRLAAADHIAGELKKLGIHVTVEKLPWQDFLDRLNRGNFDLYLAETMLTADFDLEVLVGSSGALNYGRWKEAETDRLLNELRAAPEGTEKTVAANLYSHLQNTMPLAPVCFKEQTVLTQWGRVTGLTPTRANCFAGGTWEIQG